MRNLHTAFHSGYINLHSYQQCIWVFSSHPCPHLWFLILYPFLRVWDVISLWFWFAFPWWSMMLSLFSCAIGHLYIFFGKMPIQVFCPFLNWVVFLYWVVWVLYTFLDISFLSDILCANIFSHLLGRLFIFWWFPFVCQSFSVWLGYICLFLLLLPLPEETATKTHE